jgi:hypothetical protein
MRQKDLVQSMDWSAFPYLQLILDCFQEGLAEVGNAKRLGGTATEEDQQGDQTTDSEMNHRKLAVLLALELKIMSTYERVFRSLETDGIFTKLSKIPRGVIGLS